MCLLPDFSCSVVRCCKVNGVVVDTVIDVVLNTRYIVRMVLDRMEKFMNLYRCLNLK